MSSNNELVKAVAAVMDGVARLGKNERNAHGGYNYVSVDDMKDALRPLLAKNGLEVRMTEVEHGIDTMETKSGRAVVARFVFDIRLRHVSGAEDDPERTTVMLPHTGAQTTGAAKSYALKEWLKGRFLVSTGERDADADSHKLEEYTGAERSTTSQRATESLAEWYVRNMREAETAAAFEELVSKARQAVHRMSESDKKKVTAAVEVRRAFWASAPKADAA